MGFYDEEKTASQYIDMARGYDGEELINILRKHVPQAACVLEIGMGPGVDLRILKKHFQVTGSDNSAFFLDRYRQFDPDADLMNLDAVELDTGRTFDCIYSNKVLHHVTDEQLTKSILGQKKILTDTGFIMHSFWRGTGTEEHQGLKFVYQTEANLRLLFGRVFNIVDIVVYSEMAEDDSIYILGTV
jgi:trans-aconitate methyltransferase